MILIEVDTAIHSIDVLNVLLVSWDDMFSHYSWAKILHTSDIAA